MGVYLLKAALAMVGSNSLLNNQRQCCGAHSPLASLPVNVEKCVTVTVGIEL